MVASREKFRPKVALLYDRVFSANALSVASLTDIWHELFLLRPSRMEFDRHIGGTAHDQFAVHRFHLHLLLSKCCDEILAPAASSYSQLHAALTINMILSKVFSFKWNNFTSDVLQCLCGLDEAEALFQAIVLALCTCLLKSTRGHSDTIEAECSVAALDCIVSIVTALDNLNMNGLVGFLMGQFVFDALLHDVNAGSNASSDALTMLAILCYYRRESRNPLLAALGEVSDAEQLASFFRVIYPWLDSGNDSIPGGDETKVDQQVSSFPYSVVSYVYSLVSPPTYHRLGITDIHMTTSSFFVVYTLLLANSKFRSFWYSHGGLAPLALFCLDCFCSGDIVFCRACIQLASVISSDIDGSVPLKLGDAVSGIAAARNSPFKRQVVSEFDTGEPFLSLCISYLLLNQRQGHDSLAEKTLTLILILLKEYKLEKRRVHYRWDQLYKSIISTIKFYNSARVIERGVDVLDYILCFGDHFLKDTKSYDGLFYQIILHHSMFNAINAKNDRNIHAVIKGFMSKYDGKLDSNDVLALIRNYYEEVELNLKGNYEAKAEMEAIDGLLTKVLQTSRRPQ